MMRHSGILAAAGAFALLCLVVPPQGARAQEASDASDAGGWAVAAQTQVSAQAQGPLRLSLDKSEILRFDQDIGSIILGNSVPASVLMDTSQTVVVVPKAIGATHVTILGKDGRVLMDRHIIVDSSGKGYVRIRTTCIGKEKGCTPNRSFYCPQGLCAEIMVAEPKEAEDATVADPGKAEMDTVGQGESKSDSDTGAGSESPPN